MEATDGHDDAAGAYINHVCLVIGELSNHHLECDTLPMYSRLQRTNSRLYANRFHQWQPMLDPVYQWPAGRGHHCSGHLWGLGCECKVIAGPGLGWKYSGNTLPRSRLRHYHCSSHSHYNIKQIDSIHNIGANIYDNDDEQRNRYHH